MKTAFQALTSLYGLEEAQRFSFVHGHSSHYH